MPELPEVETARRLAQRHLAGKRIAAVETADDRIVFAGVGPAEVARALAGRRVDAVLRRGKYMWIELDRRPWPSLHFGMTGSFRVYADPADRPRFLKLELRMDDGTRLAMRDPRRLGRIRLLQDPPSEPPISLLGWDPLLKMPTAGEFASRLKGRKAPIKAMMLDQSFLAGVGNWIADEVLYQARIDPRRPAGDLTAAEVARLRQKLGSVIRKAVEVDADKSRFPSTWLFHHRWGKVAGSRTRHGGIEHITVGGRTTAWVPAVQR